MDLEERVKRLEELVQTQSELLLETAGMIREASWANVYHDATNGCSWFPEGGLPCWPGRGAVGYQYMYVVFRILNELKPQNILEIGMGQSTRLIGQYIKTRESNEFKHYCVEHDAGWADVCKSLWPLDESRSEVVILPLGTMSFNDEHGNKRDTVIYNGFYDHFNGKKFDLISVDGPFGFNDPLFARIDILQILPDCLNNDFCIIVDDYQRDGERKTVEAIMEKLSQHSVEFSTGLYEGEKQTCLITSKSWSFLSCL